MEDTYKKAYFYLFNAMTDLRTAILRLQNVDALYMIEDAQKQAEEIIISAEEET